MIRAMAADSRFQFAVFRIKLLATCRGQRIELCLASRLALRPLGLDPSLLLQPMQRRVQGSLLYLQHFARYLLDAFGDGPAVTAFDG